MPGSKTLSSLHSRPPFAFAYLEPIQFPLCAIVATPFSQWLFPKLGRAIRYFINHHEALGRFIEDGAIPIDNSLIERQHVRVALTRKNFLFVGSDDGGHRAATVYTILGSCQLNDVDPVKYLADVLPRLARGVTREQARELLPHRWKAAQASA